MKIAICEISKLLVKCSNSKQKQNSILRKLSTERKRNRFAGKWKISRSSSSYGPPIVDVVSRITVIGEAGSESGASGELPNRIGLLASDAGDPASAELHRHAAEVLLPDSPSDSVRRLENHDVLDSVLRQNLRRRNT